MSIYTPLIPGSETFQTVETILNHYNDIINIDNLNVLEINAHTISDGYSTLTNGTLSGIITPTTSSIPSTIINKEYVDNFNYDLNTEDKQIIFTGTNFLFTGSNNLTWTTSTNTFLVNTTIETQTLRTSVLKIGSTSINSIVPQTMNLVLPQNNGSESQVLITDGSGNLSWTSNNNIGTINESIQYNKNGNFQGSENLLWSDTTNTLTLNGIFNSPTMISLLNTSSIFKINSGTQTVSLFSRNISETLTWPTSHGSGSQVITTNGNGLLSFISPTTISISATTGIQFKSSSNTT